MRSNKLIGRFVVVTLCVVLVAYVLTSVTSKHRNKKISKLVDVVNLAWKKKQSNAASHGKPYIKTQSNSDSSVKTFVHEQTSRVGTLVKLASVQKSKTAINVSKVVDDRENPKIKPPSNLSMAGMPKREQRTNGDKKERSAAVKKVFNAVNISKQIGARGKPKLEHRTGAEEFERSASSKKGSIAVNVPNMIDAGGIHKLEQRTNADKKERSAPVKKGFNAVNVSKELDARWKPELKQRTELEEWERSASSKKGSVAVKMSNMVGAGGMPKNKATSAIEKPKRGQTSNSETPVKTAWTNEGKTSVEMSNVVGAPRGKFKIETTAVEKTKRNQTSNTKRVENTAWVQNSNTAVGFLNISGSKPKNKTLVNVGFVKMPTKGQASSVEQIAMAAYKVSLQGRRAVLVTVISDAYLIFANSWLCNTKELGIHDSILIITTDKAIKDKLANNWPYIEVVVMDFDSIHGKHRFPQFGYDQVSVMRAEVVQHIINANIPCFLIEMNSVWFVNPVPILRKHRGDADILISSVEVEGWEKRYNTRSLFLFPTDRTKVLWHKAVDALKQFVENLSPQSDRGLEVENLNDQTVISTLLATRYGGIKVKLLPKSLFAQGQWYERTEKRKTATRPLVVNNNFIKGNNAKISRAIQWNHWFLKEDGTCDMDLVHKTVYHSS